MNGVLMVFDTISCVRLDHCGVTQVCLVTFDCVILASLVYPPRRRRLRLG
jgi:hypothetical protein